MAASTEGTGREIAHIVLGCLFTLLLCMNFSIRPNIPPPNASRLRVAAIKLYLMVWMVVMPYTIMFWAVLQWLEAMDIAKRYKSRGWSTSHGFFVSMGGLILYKEGVPCQVLSPDRFQDLLGHGHVVFPNITQHDLQQKSHDHPLLRILCVLQTLWFIIQTIARLSSGLSITPFELSTFILVITNILLLIPFWAKPLDVYEHIRVDLLATEVDPISPDVDVPAAIRRDFSRETLRSKRLFLTAPDFFTHRYDAKPGTVTSRSLNKIGHVVTHSLFHLTRDILDLHFRIWNADIRPGALSVHKLYAPNNDSIALPFLIPVCGLGFAAAHIPLYFHTFPTSLQTLLWKICIFTLNSAAAYVILVFVSICVGVWIGDRITVPQIFRRDPVLITLIVIPCLIFVLALPATLLARIFMVVDVCIDLQSLTPTARRSLPWTDYIPHFS